MSSEWNNLEIAKLFVSSATPVIVGCLTVYIHRITKQFEQVQWRGQKVIEKRLDVYDELAPLLNDLSCYFTYVGDWKNVSPVTIVELKRTVDRMIYLAQPLFGPQFFEACMHFMSSCFATYQGWGVDAKLRTQFERRREAYLEWQSEWEDCFSDDPADANQLRAAYQRVMREFTAEIGLTTSIPSIAAGPVPSNIR